MLIQELIDKLEDVKNKVGNIEILVEEFDGRSILPDNYGEFKCCFTFHKDCNMYGREGLKYNRKKIETDSWYPIRTDGVIFRRCTEEDYKEDVQGTKEILDRRGYKWIPDEVL